jgi:hypothetical protein
MEKEHRFFGAATYGVGTEISEACLFINRPTCFAMQPSLFEFQ